MKLIYKNIVLVGIVLTIALSSCLEDPDDEFRIVGAVPTVILLSSPPDSIDVGQTVNIDIRYYSPNVDVSGISMDATISAGGAEKSSGEVFSQTVTGFNTSDSYELTIPYTASAPGVASGDVVDLVISATATNDLSSRTIEVSMNVR